MATAAFVVAFFAIGAAVAFVAFSGGPSQAREARDSTDSADVSPDRVRDAIRTVAERTGARPERLLMVDYQQRAAKDKSLPSLREVFAAFGSWKRARRESAGTA